MKSDLPLSVAPGRIQDILALGFEALPFAALFFMPNDDMTLLWRNSAHEVMTDTVGVDVAGKGIFEAFPPSADADGSKAVEGIRSAVAEILRTGEPQEVGPARFDLVNENGVYMEHHWQMHFAPIREDGEIIAILQTARDVTEATLTARLAQSHRRAATSTASVAYFSYDPETDLFLRHDAIDAMFGFAPEEAGPYAAPFFERVHQDDIGAVHAEVARVLAAPPGEIASFDYRVPLPNGEERFVRIRGEIATDPIDRRPKLVGTFVDLTDIENARRELERAVEVREALVVEANHRIKNSLQIALSLLRLQASRLIVTGGPAAERARAALRAVESRVRAVADVHAAIQIDGDVARIDVITLFNRLVQSTRKSAELQEQALVFEHPAEACKLKSDTAIALSLMLNELLTNAIKHGSPRPNTPVKLLLEVWPDDKLQITVENSHSDSSQTLDIDSSGTGERLIQQFAEQIGAEVSRSKDPNRFVAQITMPVEA
ncbi:histidine kinase dimerization/phosphoacceptor domain -containing protein [uncultured Marivita sp.]|uniref:sensor histidine kinase n=1 Tax=uncultured Marivita sp. TaxID=888080 RepID=UPI00262E72AD|nr:histidine kinase dimerization/phosphoacceptor domain -containing protein [uncultured Marivita sp.]